MSTPIAVAEKLQVRVITRILNQHEYAVGASQCLTSKLGRVTRATFVGGRLSLLVEFDKAVKSWWPHQSPVTGFWFQSADLLSMPGEEDKLAHLISQLTFEFTGKAI